MSRSLQRSLYRFLVVLVLLFAVVPVSGQEVVWYVDADATGLNNGTNWTDAFTDLQSALAQAVPNDTPPQEIWVAAGTYSPGASAGDSFILKDGVRVLGGFVGVETDDEQRNLDPATNQTVLSADIGNDDLPDGTIVGTNNSILLSTLGLSSNTQLSGFTLRSATERAVDNVFSAVQYEHLIIEHNAGDDGAGMRNDFQANLSIEDCVFRNNTSSGRGGAILNANDSNPEIRNCRFENNQAFSTGGAVLNEVNSFPRFEDCHFEGNTVDFFGAQGGAISALSSGSTLVVLRRCSFVNNAVQDEQGAGSGGAIHIQGGTLEATECRFEGNTVGGEGGAIHAFARCEGISSPSESNPMGLNILSDGSGSISTVVID